MDRPTAAQQALAAYSQVVEVSLARLQLARSHGAQMWRQHKPTTIMGWTVRDGSLLGLCRIVSRCSS